jgi:hypothetical protein
MCLGAVLAWVDGECKWEIYGEDQSNANFEMGRCVAVKTLPEHTDVEIKCVALA